MRIKETNVSEPLWKCREVCNDVKTRDSSLSWDKLGGGLTTWPSGIRRTDGVTLIQALVQNVRDCLMMVRETSEVKGHCRVKVPRHQTESERLIVVRKSGKPDGAKGPRHPALLVSQLPKVGGADG